MKRRGFTLAEILVAVSLAAFLLVLGATNFRAGVDAAQNSAVAQRLAGDLREARQLAITSGFPAALAFPSAGRTRSACQSYYRLQGALAQPDLTTSLSQAPSSCLVVGSCASSDQVDPPLSDTQAYSRWVARVPDPALIFLPSGRLQSNGLPHTGGLYRILISEGAVLGPSTLGAGWMTPLQVCRPYLVEANANGQVRVTQTISGATLSPSALAFPPQAPALALAVAANRTPQATLQVWPKPNPDTLPANAEATVNLEALLALEISASDADGDPLQCTWTSNGGSFSCPGTEEMHWDDQASAWKARWFWKPPADGRAGDQFRLRCQVVDPKGATAQESASCRLTWDVSLTEGHIALATLNSGVQLMNADGTGKTQVFFDQRANQFEVYKVAWHPDSTRLFCDIDPDVTMLGQRSQIYQVRLPGNLQGTNLNVESLLSAAAPCLSPDGKYLLYSSLGLYRHELGTPMSQSVRLLPAGSATNPEWGNRGVVCTSGTPPSLVYIANSELLTPSGPGATSQVLAFGQQGQQPNWSPDGSKIAFVRGGNGNGWGSSLWIGDFQDGPPRLNNVRQVVDAGFIEYFTWSPDSSRLAYLGSDQGVQTLFAVPASSNAVPRVLRRSTSQFQRDLGRPSWFRR